MATLTPTNYDPRNTTITYGGVQLHGFTDGDFVTLAADRDTVSAAQGADGEVVVNQGPMPLHTVGVTLMQTSSSVGYLTGQALIQAQGGVLSYPSLVLVNQTTGESATFAQAWVKRPADQAYGIEAGSRDFTFGGVPVLSPGNVI